MRNKLGKKIVNIFLIFALTLSGVGGFYLLNNVKSRTSAEATLWRDFLVVKEATKYANTYSYGDIKYSDNSEISAEGWSYDYANRYFFEGDDGSYVEIIDNKALEGEYPIWLFYDQDTYELYFESEYINKYTYNIEDITYNQASNSITITHTTGEPYTSRLNDDNSFRYPYGTLYFYNNKFYLDDTHNVEAPQYNIINSTINLSQTNLATDESSEDIVILDNYTNNQILQANPVEAGEENVYSKDSKAINGIYLEFNKALVTNADNKVSTSIPAVTELTVQAYLNNTYTSQYEGKTSYYSEQGYGLRIDTNLPTNQTFQYDVENSDPYNNFYWNDYFDMTEVWGLTGENDREFIPTTSGLYTFVFNYQVYRIINNVADPVDEQFVYQFYLTDDGNYVEYPTLNRSEVFSTNSQEYSTYYYNFDSLEYPTYTYDATKYNVAFTHTDPNGTGYAYESEFSLLNPNTADEKGLLTFSRNGSITNSVYMKLDKVNNRVTYYNSEACLEANILGSMSIDKTTGEYKLYIKDIHTYNKVQDKENILVKTGAKNTPISYYYNIILSELGTYQFANKYIINDSASTFKVIEPVGEVNLAKNAFKNKQSDTYLHSDVMQDMSYNNGLLAVDDGKELTDITDSMAEYNKSFDGGYNLVVFGTKAHFYKLFEGNSEKVYSPFANIKDGIYADITSYANTETLFADIETLDQSEILTLSNVASMVPNTNLAPIYFDLYGSLTSTNTNGNSIIDSKIYRWNKNLTKNPARAGYYIEGNDINIVGSASYTATYVTDTTCQTSGLYVIKTSIAYSTTGQTAVQYYMFIVDSTTPELYYYTLDENNNKIIFPESKSYTNCDELYFTWVEPTYFQESISATLSYSGNYEVSGLSPSNNYTKDTLIGGGSSTLEGLYRITIYYGKKNLDGNNIDRSKKDCEIKVDRTAPTAIAYAHSTTCTCEDDSCEFVDNNNIRLFGDEFVVYSDTRKASGAEITARYAEVNFTSLSNFDPELLNGTSQAITTNRLLNITDISEDNLDIYNLYEKTTKTENGTEYQVIKNLKLGSKNTLAPTKLYIFELSDVAGNKSYFYYVFDKSLPYNVIQQQTEDKTAWETVNLSENTISENTRIVWGDQKAIQIHGSVEEDNNPYSIATALNHITTNTINYLGLSLSNIDGSTYLTLPLKNAEVVAGSDGKIYSGSDLANSYDAGTSLQDTTSFAQYITITPKASSSANSENSWFLYDTNYTLANLMSISKNTYSANFQDVLGNVSNTVSLYLDTDMAELSIYYNFEHISDENNHGINKGSFNIPSLYINYETQIENATNIISPYVTYNYYPFAISSYLTDDLNATKTDENIFNTDTRFQLDSTTSISPLYPFSSIAEIAEEEVIPAISSANLINPVEIDGEYQTKEGLYVFTRVYHDKDGNVLTQEQVTELSEFDNATIYMFVIVDRNGIISLEINTEGTVLTASSIGDYITMLLGGDTEDEIPLDAYTLNQLMLTDQGRNNPLFETGRVVVNSFVPNDKYATYAKLNSQNTTFNISNNQLGVNQSITANENYFRLYMDLIVNVDGLNSPIEIIANNGLQPTGLSYLKNLIQNNGFNNTQLISNGTYTLTIRDYDKTNPTYNTIGGDEVSIKFTIKHEYPSGKFVSYYNDANNTKYDLESGVSFEGSQANSQYFKSVNKDALSFEFEDNDNIYHAQIDPNHFIVQKGTMSNGAFSSTQNLLIINGTLANGDPRVETIASGANITDVFKKEQINTTTVEEDKLYRYTINIFNGYEPKAGEERKVLLSNRDEDATYAVTIFYKGQESDYQGDNGQSYFSCTYYIHQDLIAPSQNLNSLKASDKGYSEDIDTEKYFFAVSNDENNPTIFTSNDIDESSTIYVRKYNSLADFSPSLLPGDEHYGSLDTQQISFNPNVINTAYYEEISYVSQTSQAIPAIDFSYKVDRNNNLLSGYYEVLEIDEAQNITRYFIYVGNGNSTYLNFDYKEKLVYLNGETEEEQIKTLSLGKTLSEDGENLQDAPYTSQLQLATLSSIYFKDVNDASLSTKDKDNLINRDDEGNFVSAIYFDKYITAYIKNGENIVETITCDSLNESLNDFFSRVVARFTAHQNEGNVFDYTIELLNRFGENYVLECLLPGEELSLSFTETNDPKLFVEVPAKVGNVYLTDFIVQQGNNNVLTQITQALNGEITSKSFDTNGLQYARYEFGPGLYTFKIIDNFGRTSTIAKYVGTDTDDEVTINYGNPTVSTFDNTFGTITHTSKDVSLKISKQLYNVTVQYGETLAEMQRVNETSGLYSVSDKANANGTHTYIFNSTGYYIVTYSLLAGGNNTAEQSYVFHINRDKPTVYVDFESGGTRELSNNSYSENITIYWEASNGFELTGNIVYTPNSGTPTTINLNDLENYYVRDEGTYYLTITDAIGNSVNYTFTKIASSYSYFTVTVDGVAVKESEYSENTAEDGTVQGDKTRLYYYVKYSSDIPSVVVSPDASKGIKANLIAHAFGERQDEYGVITGNGYFDEYEISSSNPTDEDEERTWVICYVRIVYLPEDNDFADFTITQTKDKDGNVVNTNIPVAFTSELFTAAKELTISFNSISIPEFDTDINANIFNGNTTRLLHYYNGILLEVIEGDFANEEGIESLIISTAGIHTFEIFDLSNNQQMFGDEDSLVDRFSIYLINDVIYDLNDEIPVNNRFYNNSVKLDITTALNNYKIFDEDPIITVMYNGKEIDAVAENNGSYLFENPGYYNVTISGTWTYNATVTPLNTSFNFTIINENVALIAFNIPTSYGFTINSIYKNEANMSASIVNPTTLWLSAGDPTFGTGLFTIHASYYDNQLNKNFDFSFRVWINEETPTILPVDYTYGTKTSKVITLQYNGAIIFSQIGEGYIQITNSEGNIVSRLDITSENANQIEEIKFNETDTYTVGLYNKEGKLVSSYKVIKTTPLNSSAKIIIIIASCVLVALTVVFIILRRKVKFR